VLHEKRINSLLGLAQRAGQMVSGEDTVERELLKNKILLLIVAADSSENTRKKVGNWANHYQVELFYFSTRDGLGKAIGKEWRAVIGVKDRGFSRELRKLFDEGLKE